MTEQRLDRAAPPQTLGAQDSVGRVGGRLELRHFDASDFRLRRVHILIAQERFGGLRLFRLAFHQAVIHPARGHKFAMGSAFGDAALIQRQNTVGADHAGQAVREDQRRAPFHQPVERVLDHRFVFRVHR